MTSIHLLDVSIVTERKWETLILGKFTKVLQIWIYVTNIMIVMNCMKYCLNVIK